MTEEKILTSEDRDKIRQLLETVDSDNVRLAISLLEETASDGDLEDLFTKELIGSLLSSGDQETFTLFLRRCERLRQQFPGDHAASSSVVHFMRLNQPFGAAHPAGIPNSDSAKHLQQVDGSNSPVALPVGRKKFYEFGTFRETNRP